MSIDVVADDGKPLKPEDTCRKSSIDIVAKWETLENKLREKGIIPQTDDWHERSKFWLFAHGAGLDPNTGLIVAKGKWTEKITRVVKKLVDAIEQV